MIEILHDFRYQNPMNSGNTIYIESCWIFTNSMSILNVTPTILDVDDSPYEVFAAGSVSRTFGLGLRLMGLGPHINA